MNKTVGYKKLYGGIMLACALFVLGTSFVVGVSLNTITGIILLLLSIAILNRPVIVYNDLEIQMKNMMGFTVKSHIFSKDKIETIDGAIYVNDKKLHTGKIMLNDQEFQELLDHIANMPS